MRGSMMRLFTKEQHIAILSANESNKKAADAYYGASGKKVSVPLVRYWRMIFIDNAGKLSTTDNQLKQHRVLIKPQPDDDISDISFIPERAESILVIPDIHAPYQHADTLPFLKAVRDAFSPDLVVQLGDELDYHALSFHDSDPNLDSAGMELERGKLFLKALAREFPEVLVCHSNHGSMVFRRAKAHGLPVQLLRTYRDIVLPEVANHGWSWAYSWRVNTPLGEVLFKHQTTGILADAAHNSCNLVVGHNHGNFSVEYCASSSHLYYGVYSGCLIDKDALAFAYGKHSMKKPIIGCTVILNGRPMLIPMILNAAGRWIGKL
jgi:hypothetical protein